MSTYLLDYANAHIAESRGRGAVTRVSHLGRLPFAAIRRAPHDPGLVVANGIARIPKDRCDARIGGVLQHANFFSAFDFPRHFRAELEIETLVVNAPRTICLHPDSIVRVRD